jgi:hypothetical protein
MLLLMINENAQEFFICINFDDFDDFADLLFNIN